MSQSKERRLPESQGYNSIAKYCNTLVLQLYLLLQKELF